MVGERLAACRKRAGMTQVELAVELGDRYSGSMISNVERSRSNLLLDGAVAAARVLGVSLDYLTGLTDDPAPAAERSPAASNGREQRPEGADARPLVSHPPPRRARAAPRKRGAPPVAPPPASEAQPPAWAADLRDDLRELPERLIAALRSATTDAPPEQPVDDATILPFMRPSIVSIDDPIVDQIAEAADYTGSPFVQDVRPAAGFGTPVFDESSEHRVIFHRALLPAWVRAEHLVWVRATGDSMEPTMRDGDLVALDHSFRDPADGRLFVLHTEDGLVVKRLRGEGHGWEMVSDNDAYKPRPAREDDRVIGRVAWAGPARE